MIDEVVIAVVVPAFNEERWIDEVIDSMPGFVDQIVVVDDRSLDGTAEFVRLKCAEDSRVLLVCHETNRGVGAAIISGYRAALLAGAQVVAVMAGDGQMDPSELRGLVEPLLLGRADYVKGNRFKHRRRWDMPLQRLLGSALLAKLTSLAAGVPVGDSQCGYTAIGRRALKALQLDDIWRGYGYPNDLLGALAAAGMAIAEVPVRPVYRGEQSGLRPWHMATIALLIARVGLRRVGAGLADANEQSSVQSSDGSGRLRGAEAAIVGARSC